jgi:hypothetical protein
MLLHAISRQRQRTSALKPLEKESVKGRFVSLLLLVFWVSLTGIAAFLYKYSLRHGIYRPDSPSMLPGLAIGLGVVLARLLVWLVIEMRRNRMRQLGTPDRNQPPGAQPLSQ